MYDSSLIGGSGNLQITGKLEVKFTIPNPMLYNCVYRAKSMFTTGYPKNQYDKFTKKNDI